ncbi:MAG TPA: ribonuclease, partial [Desulfobacteraceae bacterium]|nr:ribonuclease [Desulfobacteraceae bacterium]
SITYGAYETCIHCNGRGMTPSVETQGLAFLRQLNLRTLKAEKDQKFICYLPAVVACYVLNTKREELMELEQKRQVFISIEIDPKLVSGQSNIAPATS